MKNNKIEILILLNNNLKFGNMQCSQILSSGEKCSNATKEELFCSQHTNKKDVNVCQHKDCNKRSTFGNPVDNQPSYCREHCNFDMICIRNK
jgi:hypothetical protein